MTRIALVDYGAGNMVSIAHALARAGADVAVATRGSDVAAADAVVVPGVGASGPAMRRLRRYGLAAAIERAVGDGAFYLGVCLGMQLLFERSEEDGAEGFGLLRGRVRGIPDAPRLPHVGWNRLEGLRAHALLAGIADGTPCYFVHSYAPEPVDPSIVLATTEHGGRFPSVVGSGRLLGVQFHPERSGADGIRILSNFVRLVRDSRVGVPSAEAGPALAAAGTRSGTGTATAPRSA